MATTRNPIIEVCLAQARSTRVAHVKSSSRVWCWAYLRTSGVAVPTEAKAWMEAPH
jgi:hypothetical protein